MDIWPQVDALIERAKTVSDLHRHRLHLYAAWRWRSLGRPVSAELLTLERGATALRLATPVVLSRIREVYDGPMVILKGADVAAHYPRPGLRPSYDLDLLVPDAESVHRALLDHGFEERPPVSHEPHHLQTLAWPGAPIGVEIHRGPNWPMWLRPPSVEELMAAATAESALGHGTLALSPAHHTLVLTAHLWRDDPMGRLGHLIDVFLMARHAESDTIDSVARRWGIEELWRTTYATAARVLLGEGSGTLGSRLLTRSIESTRERTVIEAKLVDLSAPFFVLAPARAAATVCTNVLSTLKPASNETWGAKLKRTAKILRQSFSPVSEAPDPWPEDELRRKPSE